MKRKKTERVTKDVKATPAENRKPNAGRQIVKRDSQEILNI